ncbi:hypothetical protein FPOA_13158 [Fusarium poae]|uniref:Uncharacterized protein n=1 Tax=Fusarium poae TaxID=36050 RepID=A0A1B8A6H9_FUSPO|nr:hypothetical protein FPOA_13158 [Fusarium poae]
MLDKGQKIGIGPRSSIPLHIDIQQPRDESHIQQLKGLDESSTQDLRELIRLQTVAISALEKSTRLLGESISLLQNHTQENQHDRGTSTRQEATHNDDLKSADAIQINVVASTSSDLPNHARKEAFAVHTCNLENITVGKESQQTIILEGEGSMRAKNITTGDGSVQLIGQLSDVTLQKIVRSWN